MQVVNTYQCNFKCGHCLFSCSPKRKEILHNYTLMRFMEKARSYSDYINYTGGEIFLNPEWEWQIEYLSHYAEQFRIVTNGSRFYTRDGKRTGLLNKFLGLLGRISYNCDSVAVCISDDTWHLHEYSDKNLYPLDDVIYRFKQDLPESVIYEKDNRWNSGYVIGMGEGC